MNGLRMIKSKIRKLSNKQVLKAGVGYTVGN